MKLFIFLLSLSSINAFANPIFSGVATCKTNNDIIFFQTENTQNQWPEKGLVTFLSGNRVTSGVVDIKIDLAAQTIEFTFDSKMTGANTEKVIIKRGQDYKVTLNNLELICSSTK